MTHHRFKKSTLIFLTILLLRVSATAQDSPERVYRKFPIMVGITFQNFAMPFKDLKSNFSHIGFTIGTEYAYNQKQTLGQQVHVGYYLNKEMGNGFFAYTQAVYRPRIIDRVFPELKIGAGWQRIYHPVQAYKFHNGTWEKTVGGKSQLILPIGISIGYNDKQQKDLSFSPFISYQIIPALGYNDVIPLNFYSMFQLGTRVRYK